MDSWDEVWAEYDARRLAAQPRPVPAGRPPKAARPRRPVRPLLQAVLGLGSGGMLLLGWLVLPWMLAAQVTRPLGTADAAGLSRHFDERATMESLRDALAQEIPDGEGEGAKRFLAGMAERMAESWARPESLAAWMEARVRGGRMEGGVAALSTLRAARATGLSSFRLEYGPRRGEGGVAFDLAWQGDAFRITGLRFLGEPPAPLEAPAVPVAAARPRVLAMR